MLNTVAAHIEFVQRYDILREIIANTVKFIIVSGASQVLA